MQQKDSDAPLWATVSTVMLLIACICTPHDWHSGNRILAIGDSLPALHRSEGEERFVGSVRIGQMILLRLIRGLRDVLPYLLMASLIGEGLIAFLAMFTFPPLSLLMVFVALGSLAVFVLIRWCLERLSAGLERLLGLSEAAAEG